MHPILLIVIVFALLWSLLRLRKIYVRCQLQTKYGLPSSFKLVAFFHPYCNSGGGGERVLWTAIKSMCERMNNIAIVIYLNNNDFSSNATNLVSNVKRVFGVTIDSRVNIIHFVPLKSHELLSPRLYPILTLAGQAVGSIVVGLEALMRCPPDVFIDTTGFAFLLPLFRWCSLSKTIAYVHYPTISSTMLDRVHSFFSENSNEEIVISYNNAAWISSSKVLSFVKFVYYKFLIIAYGFVGCRLNVCATMTNSSWTQAHISRLWGGKPTVLFPPCSVSDLGALANIYPERLPWILSVGQFRPEKNHELQIKAFHLFLKRQNLNGQDSKQDFKLLLIGGCRDATDEALVDKLKAQVNLLNMNERVIFHVNIPYDQLKHYFSCCSINLHTMIDEHFGIGVVEGMAAGLLTVAHNSGGPLMDIIGPRQSVLPNTFNSMEHSSTDVGVGYLASTCEEYADTFEYILNVMPKDQFRQIQSNSLRWVRQKFSEDCFTVGWMKQMAQLGL